MNLFEIREKYRLLRFKKKIKSKELAKVLGVVESQISNFEHGRNGMSEKKLLQYMNYIDNTKTYGGETL
ncbi:helix-turn-helix domain-containing protein [Paenibacillus chitinolyticus]|uniref:helix-turn-helix domain-containing protein n=1 Tax=Paenibacillus chitinolyticus TaxID=79263 RepID=UPI00364CD8EC